MTSSNIGKKMFIFCLLCNFIKLQGKITFQIYHWFTSINNWSRLKNLPAAYYDTYTMYVVLVSALQAQERKATHK